MKPFRSQVEAMHWTAVDRQLPGAHRCQPHSRFASLEAPAVAKLLACRPAPAPRGRPPATISLDGLWERALDPDQALTRTVDFNMPPGDAAWEPANVPQNYGLEPALHFYFGPLWYRRVIQRPAGARWVGLELGAVDYLADIVLNGEHLGRHEGYFTPFRMDLSERLGEGRAAELLIRVQDPLENLPDGAPIVLLHRKRWIKGTMNYHDSRPGGMPGEARAQWTFPLGQSRPSGGIVGPVRLCATGPVRLDGLFVTPLDLEGHLHLAVVLFNRTSQEVTTTVVLEITAPNGPIPAVALDLLLVPGANRIDLEGQIPAPQLWYDAALFELGRPNLYNLRATALVDDTVSSVEGTHFGLRTAAIQTAPCWRYVLNGEEVFLRAANCIPTQHWAHLGSDFYMRDFVLLQQAHLHSVGLHAHLQSPACYAAADRMGVSVFQDFPLQWAYASGTREDPGFIPKATAMAAEMAYLLWNHPSVVYYACHNEPFHVLAEQSRALLANMSEEDAESAIRDPQLQALLGDFSWLTEPEQDIGNYCLDLALEETLQKVDPIRHVHLASGWGDDIHEYSGTIGSGTVYDVGMVKRAPFVSEYGSWPVDRTAVAHSAHWAEPWPPRGKKRVAFWREGLIGSETAEMAGALERYPNLAAFAYATERKAAFVAKYQTEFFRINRYQPYAGYRWHFFVNHWCWSGAGLLDVDRVPTLAYSALAAASRPRLVATTAEDTIFPPGPLTFPVYAINDSRAAWAVALRWRLERLRSCEVIRTEPRPGTTTLDRIGGTYVLSLPGAVGVLVTGELAGEVRTNETALLGELAVRLDEPGAYRLVLSWDDQENDYTVLIAPEGWEAQYGLQVV